MGLLGNLGGIFVTNVRVQRSNQHQRIFKFFFDHRYIGFYTNGTVIIERFTGITQEPGAGQQELRVLGIALDQAVGDQEEGGGTLANGLGVRVIVSYFQSS